MRAWAVVLLSLSLAASPATGQGASGSGAGGSGKSLSGEEGGARAPGQGEAGVEERTSALTSLGPLQLSGPVDPDVYRVGPGDVLILQLWGRVSRSVVLEVGPEGTVLVPGAGPVMVDARTLREVRDDLLRRMRSQFRGVDMDLRLARPRTFRVYLTGELKAPGPVSATGVSRVSDVLPREALKEGASYRRIDVLHRDGTRQNADLDLFYRLGDASDDPWLRDGDIVNVPVATEFVYVNGAVARPGVIELGAHDSLLTLMRMAGDPVPSAQVERALLVRFRDPYTPESSWVALDEVYARKTNLPVKDGERLYLYFIPQYHLQHEATILGEVNRPGVYPIVEGRTRLSYLVSAAGGFLPAADLSAIHVHRRNPTEGEKDPELDRMLRLSRNELTTTEYEKLRTKLASQREDYRIDWQRLRDDKELDLLLRDGDVARVERLVSSVRVDGEVRRPGILNYIAGERVDDYVRQAGGYTNRSWRSKVRVTRAVTGQTLLAVNVRTLDPGDFVWVPEKPDASIWQQSTVLLSTLTSIATIVIALWTIRK